ncbi:Auxin efflux carrier [Corchorus olitorius]|uniref:Auxin efflux carrier n=1 Tax=Corchorus olitorius TaxID=93759 RepID=A0A1R3GS21_9ROSI|nr:Auxin efflux carrier [Corchorus olitorius]
MGFLDLFAVAVMPVLKVLLVTALGLFLALDGINVLGMEARHYLNNLVFYVFSPSLVFSNLAETITFESFKTLWFMPVNIMITFIIGSALAWILIKITKPPSHLQGMVIGCCSAVCHEPNNPFGDTSVCSTNAGAYASLSTSIGAIFIWSYMYAVMMSYAKKSSANGSTNTIISSGETGKVSGNCTEPLLPSTDCHRSDDYIRQDESPCATRSGERNKMPVLYNTIQCMKTIIGKIDLKKVFAPTAIAAILGFITGTVSPIRKVVIGDSAPLHVIDASIYLVGQASIPCMTLVLGANLLRGLKRSDVSLVVIIGITVVRNIFLPLSGIGVVKAASYFGMVGSDSLFKFVLMLQYAAPPAMAVGTIAELLKQGQVESSVIMLWTYAVASFSLTLWSTLFMWLLA